MNQGNMKSKQKKTDSRPRKGRAGGKKLKRINRNAAGVDIGSREHYVCVPEECCDQQVRSFGCFTSDLLRMAEWLEECGVETIVMESTGVYWIPVYQVLEDQGFDVKLVDARQVRHVPGRKSDVMDCQWLQELHSYGLLSGAFIPDKPVSVLRSYWRHRSGIVACCAQQIHLMQKALDLMNLHLHKVLSDITGKTGSKNRMVEDIGVQVFATETPFRLSMPVMQLNELSAGESSTLEDCPPIALERITDLALNVKCTYSPKAAAAAKIHVRASSDGVSYDTADLYSFEAPLAPGQTASRTFLPDAKVMFIKVIVENPCKKQALSDISINATLGAN